MTNKLKGLFLGLALLFAPFLAHAQQNTLTQTSLSAAITSSQRTFNLASVTGISGQTTATGTYLFIDREQILVLSVNGTTVTVVRGVAGTPAAGHISGAMVLAGNPVWFAAYDPQGSCTAANLLASPVVNIRTGAQWLCGLLGKYVPGWENDLGVPQVTASVAAAAGKVTPTGPLFHITGSALAITGFNIPVGFESGSFTVIPDVAFTTTTANNIAIASTAVVGKALVFTYDQNSTKFYPSY